VFTSNNVDRVVSPFNKNDIQNGSSMSAITVSNASGGGQVFGEFENAFSITWTGGAGNGGNSTTHPWGFEVDPGECGRTTLNDFRIELKQGGVYVSPGAVLREPYLDMDVYRNGSTTPQLYLDAGASLVDADIVRLDDYGGSGAVPVALIGGNSANNCSYAYSTFRVGVWQNMGNCAAGSGNSITGE
jgi:hypothetical protein